MICRVLISSNMRELGFVKSHHNFRAAALFFIRHFWFL
nr:MAG TPA: hypothetical protein [Caudoviricetes sp.]